jgi:hypothetical protein
MKIKPGVYQHYKGPKYLVLFCAKQSETLEDMVVYVHLEESEVSQLWVRPLSMFTEEVEVKGRKVSRFTFIHE